MNRATTTRWIARGLVMLLCGLMSSRVDAVTYFVATTGSNLNTCVQAQSDVTPKATINNGGTCLASGDTLEILGGVYAEQVDGANFANGTNWTTGAVTVRNRVGQTVTVRPASGTTWVVSLASKQFHIWSGINLDGINMTATSPALSLNAGNNIRYRDAILENSNWSGIEASQSSGQGTFYELINLTIRNGGRCGAGCVAAHGIYFATTAAAAQGTNLNHLVEGCTIFGFTGLSNDSGVQAFGGADTNRLNGITIRKNTIRNNSYGTFLDGAQTVALKVYDNIVRNNTSSGIVLYTDLTGPLVYNNTIHANGDRGIEVGTNGLVTDAFIRNNSITTNTGAPVTIFNTSTMSKATIQFDDINANGNGNAVADQNGLSTINSNITTAPGYVDAAANNFHLLTGSANVDAGTTLAAVADDFDNVVRPQGPAYDIGAYELPTTRRLYDLLLRGVACRCVTGPAWRDQWLMVVNRARRSVGGGSVSPDRRGGVA